MWVRSHHSPAHKPSRRFKSHTEKEKITEFLLWFWALLSALTAALHLPPPPHLLHARRLAVPFWCLEYSSCRCLHMFVLPRSLISLLKFYLLRTNFLVMLPALILCCFVHLCLSVQTLSNTHRILCVLSIACRCVICLPSQKDSVTGQRIVFSWNLCIARAHVYVLNI